MTDSLCLCHWHARGEAFLPFPTPPCVSIQIHPNPTCEHVTNSPRSNHPFGWPTQTREKTEKGMATNGRYGTRQQHRLVDVWGQLEWNGQSISAVNCGRHALSVVFLPAAAALSPEAISVTVLRRPAASHFIRQRHKASPPQAHSAHGHRLTRAHAKDTAGQQ